MITLSCPTCGLKLRHVGRNVYYCGLCNLYYKLSKGSLLYPLTSNPLKQPVKLSMSQGPLSPPSRTGDPDIDLFCQFMEEVLGVEDPLNMYMEADPRTKSDLRRLFERWLRQKGLTVKPRIWQKLRML